MRLIITGTKRQQTPAPCVYISRSGCLTYAAGKAAILRSMAEARKELDYWSTAHATHAWRIERLPAGPVSTAILRAVEVSA